MEGVALSLPGTSRTLVDHKEGALSGLYEPFAVKVTPLAGGDPIDALAFRASASRRMKAEAAASPTFVAALRAGATEWGLSEDWRAELARDSRGDRLGSALLRHHGAGRHGSAVAVKGAYGATGAAELTGVAAVTRSARARHGATGVATAA